MIPVAADGNVRHALSGEGYNRACGWPCLEPIPPLLHGCRHRLTGELATTLPLLTGLCMHMTTLAADS